MLDKITLVEERLQEIDDESMTFGDDYPPSESVSFVRELSSHTP